MEYDAFISYSHARDKALAPALQKALRTFAKPWYRRRALSVFRDETSLSAAADLPAAIRDAITRSRFFVYLASPHAAHSKWVGAEIDLWKGQQLPQRLLIALTDGEIVWDAALRDFDWARSDALHPNLTGAFSNEPLWVDLRWVRGEQTLSPREPRFQHAIAMLAAPMHGKKLEELIGEDVLQYRRTQHWVGAVIITLSLLLALFAAAALITLRINASLNSELDFIDSVLPIFFKRGSEPDVADEPPSHWRRLQTALTHDPGTEVDWGPERLALSDDCADFIRFDSKHFDCPTTEFDADGLRTDIPGLKEMLSSLVEAIRSGRANTLLNGLCKPEERPSFSTEDRPAETQQNREDIIEWHNEQLARFIDHVELVLPDAMWQRLPDRFRERERELHVIVNYRYFSMARYPLASPDVDAEIIFMRVVHQGWCGSGGCHDLPLVAFLRVGSTYEVIYLRLASLQESGLKLYSQGPGIMPKIFLLEYSAVGSSYQRATTTGLSFEEECRSYTESLQGIITSVGRDTLKQIPKDLTR